MTSGNIAKDSRFIPTAWGRIEQSVIGDRVPTRRRKVRTASSRRIGARTEQINRRFTQIIADSNLFTAVASLDWARDPELVEGQRSQRILGFVCRETTTNKNMPLVKTRSFAQSSSPAWARISYLSVLCVSAVGFLKKSLRSWLSQRLIRLSSRLIRLSSRLIRPLAESFGAI